MKVKFFFLSFLIFFSLQTSPYAEDVRVTSTFDKKSVHINEEINFKIRVTGAKGNVQAPRIPAYESFDSYYTGRSSQMSWINGQSSASMEFSYVLVPKAEGRFKLDPIQIAVDGRQFQTKPIDVEVFGSPLQKKQTVTQSPYAPLGGSSQQGRLGTQPSSQGTSAGNTHYQAPSVPANTADENIFVRAVVDKSTVYPNEQVLLSYKLYTRYDYRWEGFGEEPQVSGFWIEEFPPERNVQHENVRIGGRPYASAEIRKVALFPTAAADYTIQPGTLKFSIRQDARNSSVFDEFFNDSFFSGGSFFARRENRLLRPQPIELKVLPYPEAGKPENFTGATGNFRMNATTDKREVNQNEPVSMKLVIEGEGNIETLEMPLIPEISAFKVYEADTSSQLFKTGHVIGGKKIFEIVFIPIEAGNLNIPPISFSFFNPTTKSYKTLRTPSFPLNVKPSEEQFVLPKSVSQQEVFKKDVEVEARDIRYIFDKNLGHNMQSFKEMLMLILTGVDAFLFVLLIFGMIRSRQDKFYESNQGLKRKRHAKSQAESRMKPLRKLLHSQKAEDSRLYFEEAEKVLTQYLSDKFNLSALGMTRSDIETELERILGNSDSLYQEVMDLYQTCDEARFARANISQEYKKKAWETMRATLSRVEKEIKR